MKAVLIGLFCVLVLAACKDKSSPEPPFFPIEDYTFEAALVNMNIDEDKIVNGKLVVKDITAIKSLDISNKSVQSLAGIEAFIGLEMLFCRSSQIREIDLSKNLRIKYLTCDYSPQLTKLILPKTIEYLSCNSCKLSTLDVSQFPELKTLECSATGLKNLDLRQNPKLRSLWCNNNQLSNLDISNNEELVAIGCSNNQLRSLNLDKNPQLNTLFCANNRISALRLNGQARLSYLACGGNGMTVLSLNTDGLQTIYCDDNALKELNFDKSINLQSVYCRGNELTSLDFSNNEILKSVQCADNALVSIKFRDLQQLSSLDISRNNLTNLDISKVNYLSSLDCRFNPLQAICVTDTAKANASQYWKKPAAAVYKICK